MPRDAYSRSTLFQIMVCCLDGAKPLSETMLAYYKYDPKEHIQMKYQSNVKHFYLRICIWECRLPKWWPLCLGLNVLRIMCIMEATQLHITGPQKNDNYATIISMPWSHHMCTSLIARFMGPKWGPSGADRTQVGPMLSPWICYLECFLLQWIVFVVQTAAYGFHFAHGHGNIKCSYNWFS